jgi:hypothetical protein
VDKDLLLDQLLTGDAITRFTATFKAGGDWSDLSFDPAANLPKIPRYVTKRRIYLDAMDLVGPWAELLLLCLAFVAYFSTTGGKRSHVAWRVGAVVVLLCAAALAWHGLPKDVIVVEAGRAAVPPNTGEGDLEALMNAWLESARSMPAPAQ